jgi:multiple sugar transport system substrate-binding protein
MPQRMNRLVFGYVAAGLFCASGGGCAKKPEGGGPEPVVLRVITAGGPNRTVETDIARKFTEKHPHIRVEFLQAPGRDYYVKALAILAAGGDLDILWMGSGFGLFSWRNALLPLDEFVRDDPEFPLSQYYPSVVEWYRHRGALLGLPYGIDVQAMAYNKRIFDAAGVPYPTPEWTFQEFVDISRRLTAYGGAHPEVCRYGAGVDKIAPYYFGLSLVTEDGLRSGLQGKRAQDWLAANVELLRGGTMTRVGAQGTLDRLGEFLRGRVAMVEAYTWDMADLRDRANFPWALQVNPLTKDGHRAGWASSSGFAISARTKHPREAWLLLKEMVGEEMQLRLMASTIPARSDLQSRYLEATGLGEANLQALLDMLPAMKTPPRIPEILEASQELDHWFELALQERTPAAEIAPRIEEGINRILSTSPARQ